MFDNVQKQCQLFPYDMASEPHNPPVLLSPPWGYRCVWPCLVFYVGVGDLNLGVHACKASIE